MFTTLVGLLFVALALYALINMCIGITGLAIGYESKNDFNLAITSVVLGALGTPLACYLAYRWFTIPVTPFTIGGRRRY